MDFNPLQATCPKYKDSAKGKCASFQMAKTAEQNSFFEDTFVESLALVFTSGTSCVHLLRDRA